LKKFVKVQVTDYLIPCHISHIFTGTPENGAMILSRNRTYSNSYTSGRVLIRNNYYWGTICRRTSFSMVEANVICHQMTYSGASSWSYAELDEYVNLEL